MPEDASPQSRPPLRSEFANDPEMIDIVEMFVQDMPERVDALQLSYRAGEIEGLRRLAHQLKGASGGFGFPTVGEAASRLESSLNSVAAGSSTGALQAIKGEFDRLIELCRSVSFK